METLPQKLDREADEIGLWRLPRAEARERLVEHYLPFAKIVAQARVKQNRLTPVDDAIQEASIGLMIAVERFDPHNEQGAAFTTYANWRVRGEAIEAERKEDWVSHNARMASKNGGEWLPGMFPIEPGFDAIDHRDETDPRVDALGSILTRCNPAVQFYAPTLQECDRLDTDALGEAWGTSPYVAGIIARYTERELRAAVTPED